MNTLSYGYQKPVNPDTGDVVFPALEADIQQMNDHAHNGTDSAPLAVKTLTALHGNWGSDLGGGSYRQTLTLASGFSYDVCELWVKRSTGERCYPTLVRISASQFYLYTNDNSLDYTVYYR